MRMPPLPADSIHARACKLKCEKILTRPAVMTVKQKTPLLTRLLLKCLSHAPPFGLVYHISLKFPTPLAKKRQKPIGFCLFLVEISGIEPLTS